MSQDIGDGSVSGRLAGRYDVRRESAAGIFMLAGVNDRVGGRDGFPQVLVIVEGDTITVADLGGEMLIEHQRAPATCKYSNGDQRQSCWF